jgi:magnesium-transporting ATPase (P-type)
LHLACYLPSNHNWPKYRGWEIRSSLQNIKETPTPLQIQIQKFVKVMAIMGIAVFLLVWGVYFGKRITF